MGNFGKVNSPFRCYDFKKRATVETHNEEKRTGTYLREDDFYLSQLF